MSAESLFQISTQTALASWILLIAFGWVPLVPRLVTGLVVPALLSAIYAWLIVDHFPGARGGFDSLADVALLFENRHLLLAGWIHYLAFDLFVGSWIVRDARRLGIRHWMTVPSLALTFLFGPAGLLLHYALRTVMRKEVAVDETSRIAG